MMVHCHKKPQTIPKLSFPEGIATNNQWTMCEEDLQKVIPRISPNLIAKVKGSRRGDAVSNGARDMSLAIGETMGWSICSGHWRFNSRRADTFRVLQEQTKD